MRSDQKPAQAPSFFQPSSVKHVSQYNLFKWHEGAGIGTTKVLTKRKDGSRWYVKQDSNGAASLYEVVASEFARLLIPGQPKTRWMTDDIDQQYIASREVDGFVCFKDMHYDALSQGLIDHTYYGLGWVCVVALLTNEYDLNLGNVGVNKHHQVIKIDGGHAFIQYHANDAADPDDQDDVDDPDDQNDLNVYGVFRQQITADIIRQLPLATSYGANHWLHNRIAGCMTPCRYSNRLQGDPVFRREVNQAILRALILPPALIEAFVRSYCVDDADMAAILTQELRERLLQLKASVACDNDFNQYLLSEDAACDLDKYVDYLETFHTTSKQPLMVTACLDKSMIMQQFENLRTYLPTSGLTVTQVDISQFLFTSVQEVMHALPMMAKRYWQEWGSTDERKPAMVIRFLEAFTFFLQSYPISEAEADRIVNAAYLHNACCFYSIYTSLSNALKPSENILLALGFYKKFNAVFKKLSTSHLPSIIQAAEEFVLLYDKYGHMLHGHNNKNRHAGFVRRQIVADIGPNIRWDVDLTSCDLTRSVSEQTSVALMLIRLGVIDYDYILNAVTLAQLRDQLTYRVPFFSYSVTSANGEKKASMYFPANVYYREIRRRLGNVHSERFGSYLTGSDIEHFIQSNRFALAVENVESQAVWLLSQYINRLLALDLYAGIRFVRNFYLNPDYQYGLYAVHKVRVEFMPKGKGRFFSYFNADEFQAFSLFAKESDYDGSPHMSLLMRQVRECIISCEEFFRTIDLHFAIRKMPLNIFIKLAPFASRFAGTDVSDALIEISNLSYLRPKIRSDLQIATIMTGKVNRCPLSFNVLCDLFLIFSDSSDCDDTTAYMHFIRLLNSALTGVATCEGGKYASVIWKLEKKVEKITLNQEFMSLTRALIDEFKLKYKPVETSPKWMPRM